MTGIRVSLHHVTHYRYDRKVAMGMQTIRLRPAPHTRSPVSSYSLTIAPKDHFINWQQDPFGNYLARVVFPKKISELKIEVDLVAEIRAFNPFDFFLEDYAKDFPFTYETGLKEELAPYLEIKERGPELMKWLANVNTTKRSIVDFLVEVNTQFHKQLSYTLRMEPGVQSSEETLTLKSGSCRDMAWLLCQALRHLGFATRFASGYLIQLKGDDASQGGPAKDFTDLHAWTEVYLPGAGWIGLDATSGLFTGEGHIPLCSTPNPSSAAAVSGSHGVCESTLEHTMTVERIYESPRVSKPFSSAQWRAIDALGTAVDRDLKKHDVRLTMGGEPTFISDDDRQSDEWHFTALSENKKKLGNDLFLRLRDRFAPGSLLQYAQGKWYPGEILPRWAMNCIWRKDGQTLWKDPALLARPGSKNKNDFEIAESFIRRLAPTIGIPDSYVLPAFEDEEYYAWKEKTLPLQGDLSRTDAFEKAERARVKLLRGKMKTPQGFVLPLSFARKENSWISNAWKFGAGRLTLIPGDSPVGLRLPLSSLPWIEHKKDELWPERPLSVQNKPLPKRTAPSAGKPSDAAFKKDPNGNVRSALCAQMREGALHLFLPPVSYVEHYLDLIAHIEAVATELKIPVVLEGYAPPADLRIQQFSVTPDPGVIEVNVQPASDWEELKSITNTVYEEAKNTRLSAEKFLLDGKRVGTGGGNHIVLGAATPEASPFLRRPDLLASMLAFWQNHPSLSYLFAGMYVGPTSQAPRIDEARDDSLYELEIALDQVPEKGNSALVDKLFRNLLVDLTGNTHRAEFCIDKLASPAGGRGSLGLLEMRAFEMTPHPQMNLLQALLIRALVAHFWQAPYKNALKRLGTDLHDRFMLPYYIEQDFSEVLAALKSSGYNFKPEWFAPFFAFRFPSYGTTQVGPITLELSMALEPWPVMGEELNAGAVSRSVDSSVERLQVLVRGLNNDRYVVTCNGRTLPLHATTKRDTLVAGVRYKAWAPSSCLHPSIPVHTPLVFDVIDTELGKSIGGCTYHVMHPGGRSYDTIPVNDNEAEGRRISRFEPRHTPGKMRAPEHESNPDFPHTLDLRK